MTHDWEIAVVGHCPICGQGRQWVVTDNLTSDMYVCCEECEAEWKSPKDAPDPALASRDQFGPYSPVRVADLRNHPWFAFVINKGVLEP
jgi:hypothetical protein